MPQSPSLAGFFERFGGLDDLIEGLFPLRFGRHALELALCRLRSDDHGGGDALVGTFRVVEYDERGEDIVSITEQDVSLLVLPPAVAADVYLIKGVRLRIDPEVVKSRLARHLAGLRRAAEARYGAVSQREALRPDALV